MKKAEGLTLNTMAIAAIVLVVIVVTIAIFTGVAGDVVPFFKSRTECSSQAGSLGCFSDADCEKENGEGVFGLGCDKKDAAKPYCCIKNQVGK